MDKKPTDSEIKKAVECCANDKGCKENKCPFFETVCTEFSQPIEKYAFDLINRLQAEKDTMQHYIDHLKTEIENYKQVAENQQKVTLDKSFEIKELKAEIVRLKDYIITVEKEVDWYQGELRHSDKKVATKAYKEVFKKLNDKALVRKIKLFGNWFIVKGVTLHDINTLKNELVGEDNG